MKNTTRKREGIHGFCHTCPYNIKGDPVCLSCKGASDNFGAMVHLDAYEDCDKMERSMSIIVAADYRPGRPSSVFELPNVSAEARDIMLFLLAEISTIEDADAPLMVNLIGGRSVEDIAKEARTDGEQVRQRWLALRDRYPVCAAYVRRINGRIEPQN